MQKHVLNDYFLTSDPIDFEYKKYLLLGYEQQLNKCFDQQKVYPYLQEILDKIRYVNEFLTNIKNLEDSNVEVNRIDWLKKEIIFKTKITDSIFDDVKEIAVYAKEILFKLYTKFRELYDEIEKTLVISGYKISIFDQFNGYLVVKYKNSEKIMEYEVVRLLYPEPSYVLKTWKPTIQEFNSDKYQRNIFDIMVQEKNFPLKESVLPILKRKFLTTVLDFGLPF